MPVIAVLFLLTMSASSWAGDFSKVVIHMGPWTIKSYQEDSLAFEIGSRCVAVQYANGAEAEVMADPDNSDNKETVKLFVAFANSYSDARVFIDDAMRFDNYLNEHEPQRGRSSGIFKVNELGGDKLFVTFSVGRMDVGRYTFALGDMRRLSSYLHQKNCILHTKINRQYVSKEMYDKIEPGMDDDKVARILGVPDETDMNLNDRDQIEAKTLIWEDGFGNHRILISFDGKSFVIAKKIESKSR